MIKWRLAKKGWVERSGPGRGGAGRGGEGRGRTGKGEAVHSPAIKVGPGKG